MGITDAVSGISGLVNGVLDRVWPNPSEVEKTKLEALKVAMTSELAIHATNQAEAKHPSLFVAGWRPAVGWICASGLAYNFIVAPMLIWLSSIMAWPVPPTLDIFHLMGLLSGMLGFGAYRTYEKQQGVSRSQWRNPDNQ